jgi:hypothetical protein
MGWLLVTIVGIIVVLMGLFSILKSGSNADDVMLGDRQYEENN